MSVENAGNLPLFGQLPTPAAGDQAAAPSSILGRLDDLVLQYFRRECSGDSGFCEVSKASAAAAIGIAEEQFTQSRRRLLLAGLILVDASRVGYSPRVALAKWPSMPGLQGKPADVDQRMRRLQELVHAAARDAGQLGGVCEVVARPGTGEKLERVAEHLREAAALLGGADAT